MKPSARLSLDPPSAPAVLQVRDLRVYYHTLRGAVRATILRGEVIARDGEPIGTPSGRLVRAKHT